MLEEKAGSFYSLVEKTGFFELVEKTEKPTESVVPTSSSSSLTEKTPQKTQLPSWLSNSHWGIVAQVGFSFEYVMEVKFISDDMLRFCGGRLPAQTCRFGIFSDYSMDLIFFDYHGKRTILEFNNSDRSLKAASGKNFERIR